MKKYSNFNYDDNNDVTRIGWKELVKTSEHDIDDSRLHDNILVNQKEKFENTNDIINSLQSEILDLKKKLSFISEKDKEIYKLQNENEKINEELKLFKNNEHKYLKLQQDNEDLQRQNNDNSNNIMELEKVKSENMFLKELLKNNKDISETELKNKIDEKPNNSPEVNINRNKLQNILINKIKENNEDKINNILDKYKINTNCTVKKSLLHTILAEINN